jgi:hypothetical protein
VLLRPRKPLHQAAVPSFPRQLAATLALGAVLAVWTLVASAARTLPKDAGFAKAAAFDYPNVKVGNKTLRLAVGSRIRNEHNLIIMPVAAPKTANVLFKTDGHGEISEIWILTDEESQSYSPPPTINQVR